MPFPKGGHQSPEARRKVSESLIGNKRTLGYKQSEETKRKRADANRGKKRSEEFCRKLSEQCKGKKISSEEKIHISEKVKLLWEDPEYRRQMSDAHKGKIQSAESRRKKSESQRGEKHWNWKGGLKQKKYCYKFNEILKENVRNEFGRTCFICNAPENGERLSVHHCDYNKGQGCGQYWCLVPLCRPCHARTGLLRHYYFNFLANYWASKYMDGLNGEYFDVCSSSSAKASR